MSIGQLVDLGLQSGYNRDYTPIMNAAISIPDEVFEAADHASRKRGVSRSDYVGVVVSLIGMSIILFGPRHA